MLLALISHENKRLVQKEETPGFLADKKIEVLLTMGAGDIDTLVEPIEMFYRNTLNK